ncbi:MAG: acyl-CoA desaturase [Actinomycetia bacterium]|nr:acyl-CoA desaturase [Actinomycetes bacterium]
MTPTLTPTENKTLLPASDDDVNGLPEVVRTAGAGAAGRPDGFDADAFAAELDALRAEVLDTIGAGDADYIRRMIRLQRRLELAGRAALVAGVFPPAWFAGVAMLSLSKILENMEIGHNVMHGQWDWMQDPAIHSTNWEWDNVCPSSQWKHTHNHMHHQWTNVRGVDADIGYGLFRVDPEQPWSPATRWQPLSFVGLATVFEYGVGFHDARNSAKADNAELPEGESPRKSMAETFAKIRKQVLKDFVAWPAVAVPFGVGSVVSSVTGAAAANVVRNLWSFAVIFCGHFPDGVDFFDPEDIEGETRGDWYRRQVLGSVNFTGGPLMDVMSGNLDHQIEHHLFPDVPSNRYAEMQPRVRDICARHGVEYNTASFARQIGTVIRKVWRLASKRTALSTTG